MATNSADKKRVVIVHWKNSEKQPFEVFSNLKNFCLSYPEYNYNTLNNYLSKEKVPFDNKEVRVERKNVITRPKEIISSGETDRMIAPVVRRVAMKEADDAVNDLEYWLKQPPAKRLQAVTFIMSQFLRKGARMDKTIVNRKKSAHDPGERF
ncbi:hypothetical protein ACFOTA_21435 [Chitinophaga sp. GCM10012297]|uniref:Uncharacterized protein n=1 Tax=Chitinophaga chungangae TaxID=2821488 RepID=A0ABS3YJC7_9BACT|nr:hypothetical protein [Chitinophaga chungangae]MBO9154791.1 hypothetical protein [Chitinophaga chungangae]